VPGRSSDRIGTDRGSGVDDVAPVVAPVVEVPAVGDGLDGGDGAEVAEGAEVAGGAEVTTADGAVVGPVVGAGEPPLQAFRTIAASPATIAVGAPNRRRPAERAESTVLFYQQPSRRAGRSGVA
jgi:hypothetical protein